MVLAAREVRRYVYSRNCQLLPIVTEMPKKADAIVLGREALLDEQQYRWHPG